MRYSTWPIRILFPSVLCRTTSPGIHLTFDDGPHPVATPQVLNILREHKVKATFFLTGEKAQQYPDLVRRIRDEQHAIGNHGYSHENLFLKSGAFVRREIEMTSSLIRSLVGTTTRLFRPPFGSFDLRTLRIARDLDHRVVLWSYDSRDFEAGGKKGELELVPATLTPGSIVLLHDNGSTAQSISGYLPRLVESLQERGTTFSPLTTGASIP
ncbi:MAG: polysaccharide deacetylase family protein [Bacteroidota bacterium]